MLGVDESFLISEEFVWRAGINWLASHRGPSERASNYHGRDLECMHLTVSELTDDSVEDILNTIELLTLPRLLFHVTCAIASQFVVFCLWFNFLTFLRPRSKHQLSFTLPSPPTNFRDTAISNTPAEPLQFSLRNPKTSTSAHLWRIAYKGE